MLTIFLAHAAADGEFAGELAGFLECGTGARVFVEEGRTGPGEDLIAKVNDGRMADVVVALLSPASTPAHWPLREWQDAFWRLPAEEDVAVATLLLADCRFPELLRRRNFFDMAGGRLAAFRAVKRRVLAPRALPEPPFVPAAPPHAAPEADLESLGAALADQPGFAVLQDTACALDFAARHAGEFEAVFWARATGTDAALTGDLAAQAGLAPNGRPEVQLEALRRLCEAHRFLLVLDGAAEDRLGLCRPRGLTSVLAVDRSAVPVPGDLPADETGMLRALAACGTVSSSALACATAALEPARGDAALASLETRGLALRPDARFPRWLGLCDLPPDRALAARHAFLAACGDDLAAARHAFAWAAASGDWALAAAAGRRAFSLADSAGRLGEAHETLEVLERIAAPHGDDDVLSWCLRERCRILDRWELHEESAALRRAAGAYCGMQQGFAW